MEDTASEYSASENQKERSGPLGGPDRLLTNMPGCHTS
jgi:hypothetical protein